MEEILKVKFMCFDMKICYQKKTLNNMINILCILCYRCLYVYLE